MSPRVITASGAATSVSAARYGILSRNYGTGATSVTINGNVTASGTTGSSSDIAVLARGILAINFGTDLTVSTGAGTSVSAARYGILSRNYGTGATSVTINGNVTASGTTGSSSDIAVLARGNADVAVTTAAGAIVSGQDAGILARSDGNNAVRITVAGDVTGASTAGIYARSGTSGSIAITVAATSHVTSNGAGADGFAIDTSSLVVSATSLTVAGTLNGGAGGAVRFRSLADRLELQPTAVINGNVFAGAGIDTFALGGTGTASFDVSKIGASAQYRDFEVFEKDGASQWTLTGTNTTIPLWVVNAGLLSVGGSMANTAFIVNGGVLALTGTGNIASVNIASATGVFDISGTTAGATISTLSGVTGSSVMLGGRTLTLSNASGTFSGVIGGTGGLVLSAGIETLTGVSTYTGSTTLNGGILSVPGLLASPVIVNSTAALIGNGAIGGLTVNSGGTVMPGNPLGTLTVNGNLALNAGALLHVDVGSTGQGSGLTVNGNVQLTGATLQLHVKPGDYGPATDFIVIDNKGSNPVQGTFASVKTTDLPFLVPFVTYNAGTGNDVGVRLLRNDVDFCFVTVTANQCSVVRAFQKLPLDDKLLIAVITQTAEGARQAADAVSGEIYPTINGVLANDSHLVRQAVLGRLRQMSYDGESGAMAALAGGGPQLASFNAIADGDATALAYAGGGKPASPSGVMPATAKYAGPAVRDLTVWAQSIGAWGNFGGDGNAADVRRTFGGVVGGFDGRFGNWRAGLVTGYSQSSVNVGSRASSALIDTGYAGLYAVTSAGAWNLRSGAAYALHDIGASRTIAFPGFSDRTSARYRGDTAQIFGEAGYGLKWGTFAAEPFAGLSWVHIDAWRFAETGGAAALSGANNTVNLGFSSLGMRVAANYLLPNGAVLTPRASLAWEHGFGDVIPAAGLAFASSGTSFTIAGVPLARDVARVDVGADLRITPQARIGVFYSGQFSGRADDHAVKGGLTWNF
jgi:outer membrane autotransporter protein